MKNEERSKKSLADLVLDFPTEKGDQPVLECLNATGAVSARFSYRSLREACLQVAWQLAGCHRPGKVVLLAVEDPGCFTQAFFGCILAGLVPAPLAPGKNRAHSAEWQMIERLIADKVSDHILVQQAQAGLYESRPGLAVTGIETLLESKPSQMALPELGLDQLAYIQYSSGSTGMPKGVALTHRNVLSNLAKMHRVLRPPADLRAANWLPLYHDMGLVGTLMMVLYEHGFGVLMPPAAFLAQPGLWLQTISDYQCNSAAAPAFAFEYCCNKALLSEKLNLSQWKYVFVGAETVTPETLFAFSEKLNPYGFDADAFKPVYGLAEATLLVAGGNRSAPDLMDRCINREIAPGIYRALLPYPLEDTGTVSIHDPIDGSLCAAGDTGEIWIADDSCSAGYYGQEMAGEKKPLRTGDLGFILDNLLYLSGRLKDLLIIRGANYPAEDLEYCCRRGQAAIEAPNATLCLALPDSFGESLLVLQEVHRHLPAATQLSVKTIMQANLANSFGISAAKILLVPAGCLPRTRNHKLARHRAQQRYLSGDLPLLSRERPSAPRAQQPVDPAVIVGMACRFPGGADSPEQFWELLASGRDAIREIPTDRWNNELFFDPRPAVPGKLNTRWAGLIDGIDLFDPAFFSIADVEAPEIDPQQRLLLETSWRLLENTGWRKEQLAGSGTGVFIGISTNDYLHMKIKLQDGQGHFNAYSGLGNSNSIAANRLSYFYDLKGPSLAVDTACSSSLTAFHLAAEAILNDQCCQAIAGGVNAILSPMATISLSQFGMLSPVGRCRAFDTAADGYVRSEGCGLVMLKRRSAALKDGDRILAVLRASVCGQDGHSRGITFPNGEAQYRLLKQALAKAGLSGNSISYIEAHGTGTAAGDPVEMEQIRKIYGSSGSQSCYVGAVKANIGHLEPAAGIASVIKGLLMLRHQAIPPQIHLRDLHPAIHLDHCRLRIARSLTPWATGSSPRQMAISSFGFGGSLAHVILEEPPVQAASPPSQAPAYDQQLLVLSAPNPESLAALMKQWSQWLQPVKEILLPSACYSQAIHRSHFRCRTYLLGSTPKFLQDGIRRQLEAGIPANPQALRGKTCFLFTGQGEHYMHMGRVLYRRFPVFAHAFDRCADAVGGPETGDLLRSTAFSSKDTGAWRDSLMQPILFAVQYALAALYQSCGCAPDIVIGHSLGEYAAACVAGCFSPEDGMRLLHKRGLLMESLSERGCMATIFAPHTALEAVMDPDRAQIAAINSEKKTVVSGDVQEISRLIALFAKAGSGAYLLETNQAFHSHYVSPALNDYLDFAGNIAFQPAQLTWISSYTANRMDEAPQAAHWARHMRDTVRFSDAVGCLSGENIAAFIEIGPGSSSLVSAKECLPETQALLLRSLNYRKADRTEDYFFLDSIGQCYQAGYPIRWEALLTGQHLPVPEMPFMRKRYWAEGLTADRMNAVLSQRPPVSAVLPRVHHQIDWVTKGQLQTNDWPQRLPEGVGWIIAGPSGTMADAITNDLKTKGASTYRVTGTGGALQQEVNAAFFEQADKDPQGAPKAWKLLYLCDEQTSFDQSGSLETLEQALRETTGGFLSLIKACCERLPEMTVWVITQNCQLVSAGSKRGRLQLPLAALWGFCKTFFLEHPECRGGLIDADADAPLANRTAEVLAKVTEKKGEAVVAIRQGTQFVQQLHPIDTSPGGPLIFRNDGAFIITGGLGGLGLASAEWAVEKGCRHLVLISRKILPEPAAWDSLSPDHPAYKIVKQLRSLISQGALLEVVSMDVSDTAALEKIFSALHERQIPVRGVMHAAGVNWPCRVLGLDQERLLETFKIKISASWALHLLTQGMDLDCFILFSSVTALFGSADLSHYSAANHFMDMLAVYRSQAGLPATGISWGPWAEVGMSAPQKESDMMQRVGYSLLSPAAGVKAMEEALTSGRSHSLIASIHWAQFQPFIDFSMQPSLFEKVKVPIARTTFQQDDRLTRLRQSPAQKARETIEELIRGELRSVMLIESMDSVDAEQRFHFLGLDSLMAISLLARLESVFQCPLPSTLSYSYPTIRALRDHIFELLFGTSAQGSGDPPRIKGACLRAIRRNDHPRAVTLYCFPFAGSGASFFESWAAVLPAPIQLFALQLPGREDRSSEAAFTSMQEATAAMVKALADPQTPYCFFGHSLGALMAYEVYVALKNSGKRLPEKLLFSGCGAPVGHRGPSVHLLAGEDFIDRILNDYGNGLQEAERRTAIQQKEPLLRADLQIWETYSGNQEAIDIPVAVMTGSRDQIALPANVKRWVDWCSSSFRICQSANGHSLHGENQAELIDFISRELVDVGQ